MEDFLRYFDYSFDSIEWVLLAVIGLAVLVKLFFYLFYYRAPLCFGRKQQQAQEKSSIKTSGLSVSVVIVASEASYQLQQTLPSILGQKYPNFDVIVVNDGSTDETDELVEKFCEKYSNLYTTYLPTSRDSIFGRKKLAMTIGIKASKKDVILFTEPDCKPESDQWIASMVNQFSSDTFFVAGHCCFYKQPESFAMRKIAFDNLFSALQSLSMIVRRKPFTATFRNLAMRRSVFFENKGFASVLNYEHGEHLFLNRMMDGHNTTASLTPNSFVCSIIEEDEGYIWKEQRINFQQIKRKFKGVGRWFFGVENFSRYVLLIAWILLLAYSVLNLQFLTFLIATLLLLTILSMQLVIVNKSSTWFKSGNFYFSWTILNFMLPIRNIFYGLGKDKSRKTVGNH